MIPEIYCTIFSHVFILDCVGAIWEKMSRGGGKVVGIKIQREGEWKGLAIICVGVVYGMGQGD